MLKILDDKLQYLKANIPYKNDAKISDALCILSHIGRIEQAKPTLIRLLEVKECEKLLDEYVIQDILRELKGEKKLEYLVKIKPFLNSENERIKESAKKNF